MGGGGGGSNEVKETQAQKEAARVAAKQWDLYQNDFKQFEDNFIERVDSFNSNENMADTKQSAELGYARDYGDVREQSAQVLSSSGVVPTSGKFQAQMAELSTDQATSQGDTVNRAQASEQDKYVAGLSDVAAIGMGQKADALEGMGDVANTSLSKATADAEADFNKRSSNLQLAGAAAGVGLRSYQGMSGGGSKTYDAMKSGSSDGFSPMGGADSYGLGQY